MSIVFMGYEPAIELNNNIIIVCLVIYRR